MNYSLYRLKFTTSVHIGTSDSSLSLYTAEMGFCADTLFSAICHAAVVLYGQNGVDRLVGLVRENHLRFSDSMPYCGEQYYLPKPLMTADSKKEVTRRQGKAMKKLSWIPIEAFCQFTDSLHGGDRFPAENYAVSFGYTNEMTKAAVHDGEDTVPYAVGTYTFYPNRGLYVIIGTDSAEDTEFIEKLLKAVGMTGIGGKLSAGYGKFEVDDCIYLDEPFDSQTEWLRQALTSNTSYKKLLLTTSLPTERELSAVIANASYLLVRRGGFVQSEAYAETDFKKQTQYYLAAGSVLENGFDGDLYEVGHNGSHPIYRYAKPIWVEVDL